MYVYSNGAGRQYLLSLSSSSSSSTLQTFSFKRRKSYVGFLLWFSENKVFTKLDYVDPSKNTSFFLLRMS